MKYSKSTLSVCILAILMSGCGGSESDSNPTQEQATAALDTPTAASSLRMVTVAASTGFPEPNKDIVNDSILGFYDYEANGNLRNIRNDLTGSFSAMIQFAQNHTVDPQNNAAKQMPRLTSEKDALLLVTPATEMGEIESLNAEIYLNSRLIRRVALKDPSQIPASDQTNGDNRPRVQYSNRAWSIALKWDEVKPGLNIRIVDPKTRKNGRLAANRIDFAAPGELVVQSIRLGMLSDLPNGNYLFLNQPEQAGADYLQTIPAAKIIVSKYDNMILNKVMVGSGKIYDSVSDTTGDVYSGDMRGDTAKSTFSTGINLANWGVTSSGMVSQHQPQVTQSVVIHHARGKYQNGNVTHGLSGGNGILTLIDSVNNEFSHEIGHHYGLGHYPGQSGDNYFWASHHHDSGWGYIAYRDRMRGNIRWNVSDLSNRLNGTALLNNQYTFAPDSMAGGSFQSSLSLYTHYTGYSTYHKIQPAFSKPVWDETSPTGYKIWNATTRQLDVHQPKVPTSNQVWYNSANGNFLKPTQFGVPVFTILGGYDPVANVGLLYPAARGNWGNTFTLPQANASLNDASCWLSVSYANKAKENIALAPGRMGSNANKIHVNLAQSDAPKQVDLYCKKSGEQAVQLSSITIPTYATELPPAVILGKEHGFTALRKVELPQLEQALIDNQGKFIANLSTNHKVLYNTYRDYKHELSPLALAEFERYAAQEQLLYRLNRWVNVYRQPLMTSTAPREAFKNFVTTLGLPATNPMQTASMLVMPQMNSACLKAEIATGATHPSVFMSGKNGCTGDAASLWSFDAVGKIHSAKYPGYCLSGSSLSLCNNDLSNQVWTLKSSGSAILLQQGNRCLDLHNGTPPAVNGRGILTTYGCNGGTNQRWNPITQNQNFILAASTSQNLPVIMTALATN